MSIKSNTKSYWSNDDTSDKSASNLSAERQSSFQSIFQVENLKKLKKQYSTIKDETRSNRLKHFLKLLILLIVLFSLFYVYLLAKSNFKFTDLFDLKYSDFHTNLDNKPPDSATNSPQNESTSLAFSNESFFAILTNKVTHKICQSLFINDLDLISTERCFRSEQKASDYVINPLGDDNKIFEIEKIFLINKTFTWIRLFESSNLTSKVRFFNNKKKINVKTNDSSSSNSSTIRSFCLEIFYITENATHFEEILAVNKTNLDDLDINNALETINPDDFPSADEDKFMFVRMSKSLVVDSILQSKMLIVNSTSNNSSSIKKTFRRIPLIQYLPLIDNLAKNKANKNKIVFKNSKNN
jgi:hypothetical protein